MTEQITTYHPLPDLIESVLTEGRNTARSGGWQVKQEHNVVTIGTYDEPPECGGWVETKAVFMP